MRLKVTDVRAREVLDCRGNPTVQVDVWVNDCLMGRADVPAVTEPQALPDALGRLPPDVLLLVLWEGEHARPIGAALRAGPTSGPVALLVGPEGGLEAEEVAVAEARGGIPVTLGPLVLRTETAGVAALAMVLYEMTLRG